ncbi:hypothetical protein D9757_009747 [Collybiopsis confluens]|uniref:NmrA-like domain-containing protein n=1 Tax=Collybiopsis confluens TaxID=2823264 RepID=A0A8H5GYX6_9AGAR|nr:hypothetical protein D9757_009747 [Collybiopsis confluens]
MPKKILVIGATGSQGIPVIMSLLAADEAGNPSPYSVRVLTRNPSSQKAKVLASLPGVEVVTGDWDDPETLIPAMQSCYGIFANTDTLVYGVPGEIYAAIKMFEYAHRVEGMKHFLWSSLDYGFKVRIAPESTNSFGGYDPEYGNAPHLNAKGVVADFLRSQASDADSAGRGLAWTIMTTGPYMENLGGYMLGARPTIDSASQNGTVALSEVEHRDPSNPLVFDIPTKNGHIPMICLDDLGWWTRYIFDHLPETSGKELKCASEWITMDEVVDTFVRVTGIPAIRKQISLDEFWSYRPESFPAFRKKIFQGMYSIWRDDLLTRDMEWIKKTHPNRYSLEKWIRERGWKGQWVPSRYGEPRVPSLKWFGSRAEEKLFATAPLDS